MIVSALSGLPDSSPANEEGHMNSSASIRLRKVVVALLPAALAAACTEPPWKEVNQGKQWTADKRERFYSLDQGSRLMPLRWIVALKQPDGQAFMADSLRRYGFLPN